MEQKDKICVKVYFNPETFTEVTKDAVEAGKRRGGLQLFTQKKHGMAGELVSNTDGVGRFLKYCWRNWQETKALRLQQAAELEIQERELIEKKKKLGLL